MALTHQIGSYAVSDEVLSGIRNASRTTGVDFSYMMAKAARESSFRQDVRAGTSSATGLYQFIDQTWLGMVHNHGERHGLGHYAARIQEENGRFSVADPGLRREILDLRLDAGLNATMAGEYANDNRAHLERTTSQRIGPTELYLAHFLGAGGASEFLNAMDQGPGRSGAALFPAAARANQAIFYDAGGSARSLGEIHERFATQVRRDMALAADLPDGISGGIRGGGFLDTGSASARDLWTGGSGQGAMFGTGRVSNGQMSGGQPAMLGQVGDSDSIANAAYWLQMAGGEEISRDSGGQYGGRDLSLWTVLALSSMSNTGTGIPGEASFTGSRTDSVSDPEDDGYRRNDDAAPESRSSGR